MSTWKWRYSPEKCDHGICVGDCDICDRETFEDEEEEEKEGIWIPLGHVRGYLSHPYSETFKCSACGYEQYTLFMYPPSTCPQCKAKMKTEEGEPIPHWRGQDGYNLPFQLEEEEE